MVVIEGTDTIHEWDGDGPGSLMGWLLYGAEVTPEDVDLFLNTDEDVLEATHTEFGNHSGDFDAIECYVRKVPRPDGWVYAYTDTPGPGARKCVRVEFYSFWGHWCVKHIYEPASTGIPVEQVKDPVWPMVHVRITPPERRRAHARYPQDGHATVYLCAECARSFRVRMEAARAEALADFRRRELIGAAS